jgi:integrase/recombinase XerD
MTPLRAEMIKKLELNRLATNTSKAYLRSVEGLASHYGCRPDRLSREQIESYLHYLQVERELAWGSCNVAACGLLFFYTKVLGWQSFTLQLPPRKREKTLPVVLSRNEVRRLLEALKNPKHRALLMTTYSAGLRVSEVVKLQVTDIESERGTIRVEQGKGFKDRRTILSHHLLGELRAYWKIERPSVWLFPGADRSRPLTRSAAQRVFYSAKKAAGIKRGRGIHTLRHCFATHMIENGVDSTVVQSMLGHRNISTTARYLHISKEFLAKVKSPLDLVYSDRLVDSE